MKLLDEFAREALVAQLITWLHSHIELHVPLAAVARLVDEVSGRKFADLVRGLLVAEEMEPEASVTVRVELLSAARELTSRPRKPGRRDYEARLEALGKEGGYSGEVLEQLLAT